MTAHKLTLMMFSLTAALACSVDKGDDDGGGTSGSTGASDTGGATEPTGGDTGVSEGSDKQCIDTPTVLALDEVAMGGFSAQEVLADKLGDRDGALTFASEPTTLNDEWKGKQLAGTVTLGHDGGEVRWIDSEVNPDFDDSGNESGFVDCTDRMEIDVTIDFVTELGEFDEHRDAVLTATTVDRADVTVQLAPPGVEGSLDTSTLYKPTDPATVVTGLSIFGTWQGTQAGGSIMHEVQLGEGEGASVGFGELATWGADIQP